MPLACSRAEREKIKAFAGDSRCFVQVARGSRVEILRVVAEQSQGCAVDGHWPPRARGPPWPEQGENYPREVQAFAHDGAAERCGPGGQDAAAAPGGFAFGAQTWKRVSLELAATPGPSLENEGQAYGGKPERA